MRIEPAGQQVAPQIIRDESVSQVQQQQQSARQAEQQQKKTAEADKLSISQAASTINEAATSLKVEEQFRADKVNQIKAQLESNSYDPSSRNVAEKMIAQIGNFLKGSSA